MKMFQVKPFPERKQYLQLALLLNISEKRTREWFQNKRSIERRNGPLQMGE